MKTTNDKSGFDKSGFEIKNREDSQNSKPYIKTYNKNKGGIIVNGKKGFQRLDDSELNTEFITFTVSKKTKQKLKLLCIESDLSQSNLMRILLKSVLEQKGNE